jgi:hypothetical protein
VIRPNETTNTSVLYFELANWRKHNSFTAACFLQNEKPYIFYIDGMSPSFEAYQQLSKVDAYLWYKVDAQIASLYPFRVNIKLGEL